MNYKLSEREKQHIKNMHFDHKLLYNKWRLFSTEMDDIPSILQNSFELDKKFTTSDERLKWVNKITNLVAEINKLKKETLTHLQKIDMMESVLK